VKLLAVATLFVSVLYADDITLPLDDGTIVIGAQFIRVNQYGTLIPELALKITNKTSSPWRTLKLEFDVGGTCKGEPRQWMLPVSTSLGWLEGHVVVKDYVDTSIPLMGKVDGCITEIIKARLILAENMNTRIDGVSGERVDLAAQLREIEKKQEADAATQAERESLAKEARVKVEEAEARKQAVEAARQRRKQDEADAQGAKLKAEERAKLREQRKLISANCKVIYEKTIDKKRSDLTVREDEQVRACQALDSYLP